MKSREKMLLDTLKNDLLSAIIILDSENNVIFINDTATNYIKQENMNQEKIVELINLQIFLDLLFSFFYYLVQ